MRDILLDKLMGVDVDRINRVYRKMEILIDDINAYAYDLAVFGSVALLIVGTYQLNKLVAFLYEGDDREISD